MTAQLTSIEAEVRAVLDEYIAAHAARDAERLRAPFTGDAVEYTLAPPLQQTADTQYGTVEGLRAWLATFDGPIHIAYRDPQVVASDDLALVHALTSMTATPAGAPESFTFWYRSTYGLRRIDGDWRIVHVHESTPFHMDGSFRAAVDLEP
jgi:uncharacterized protein (TIGR02246 family)